MWRNPQETADLVTFTEEILNGKLHFLCSVTEMYFGFKKIEGINHIYEEALDKTDSSFNQ